MSVCPLPYSRKNAHVYGVGTVRGPYFGESRRKIESKGWGIKRRKPIKSYESGVFLSLDHSEFHGRRLVFVLLLAVSVAGVFLDWR